MLNCVGTHFKGWKSDKTDSQMNATSGGLVDGRDPGDGAGRWHSQ